MRHYTVYFNNRKRLKPGSMPTILKKEARFPKQQDISVKTDCTDISFSDRAQDVVTTSDKENCEPHSNVLMEMNCTDNDVSPSPIIEEVSEASVIVEYSDSPTTSKEIFNQEKCEFVSAYKRLLIRHDISINTGNARAIDNTKILHVSSGEGRKKHAKIDRYDLSTYDAVHSATIAEKYGLTVHSTDNSNFAEMSEFLNFSWAQSPNISEFSQQAVGYISGWVMLSIKKKKKIKCLECLLACEETDKNNISIHHRNPAAYIAAITRGYLLIPSRSVIHICQSTESLFRRACNINSGKPPVEKNFPAVLAARVFQEVTERHNLFPDLQSHNTEMFSSEEFIIHTNKLIKTIISNYIELRLYAEAKKYALSITGTNMRHFLTRSIVWAHQ